ncbi:MAG: RNA polymerase sigma factor [Polyangiales bacterium]
MASPRLPVPPCLNPVASRVEQDRPLTRAELPGVWWHLEPLVRAEAARVLTRVPLSGARHLASRGGTFGREVASQGAIHHALRANGVDDLVQDVAVAFVEAVDRGDLRASRSSLLAWFAVTTWRTAVRTTRTPAVLLFGAGPGTEDDDDDGSDVFVATTREASPLAHAERRSDLAKVAELVERLPAKLRAVLQHWLEGAASAETAERLGLEPVTARVYLKRAIDALVQALARLEGQSQRRRGLLPHSACEFRPARHPSARNVSILLTNFRVCGSVIRCLKGRRQPDHGCGGAVRASLRAPRPAGNCLKYGRFGVPRDGVRWAPAPSEARPPGPRTRDTLTAAFPWNGREFAMNDHSAHAYLGDASRDPAPVFRTSSPGVGPDGRPWPTDALFAVTFRSEDFPDLPHGELRDALPRTDYFGADGWPVGLPREYRTSDLVRREFQVYPWEWSDWDTLSWKWTVRHPEMLRRARLLTDVVHSTLDAMPSAS